MLNILYYTSLIILLTGTCSTHYYGHRSNDTVPRAIKYKYNPRSPMCIAHWRNKAGGCDGRAQSPINIRTSKVRRIGILNFRSSKWTEKPTEILLRNDGHNVIFKFVYADRTLPRVMSKGETYEFEQLHFHFGTTADKGTEHYFNNQAYGMEGHAVFYNTKYHTFDNALAHQDGLAVIGRLYNEKEHDFQGGLNFQFLEKVRNPYESTRLNTASLLFSLQQIMGQLKNSWYVYNGGLTTPECNEVVMWAVAANLIRISTRNLNYFRQLKGSHGLIVPNIRELQKLNGRTVYFHEFSKS